MLVLLDLDELTALLGYKNRLSSLRAISRGTFPIRVYKIGKPWYAKRSDVQKYFKQVAEGERSATYLRRMETDRRRERDKEHEDAMAKRTL